jgi:AraC-like DNA-binding protein
MKPPAGIAVQTVRVFLSGAMAQGLDVSELLAAAELSPEAIEDTEAVVPVQKVVQLFLAAERLSGDEHFGLHLAERVLDARASDVLQYACRNSRTVGDALQRLTRYHRLVLGSAELRLEVEQDTARLIYRSASGILAPPRHAPESILASIFLRMRGSMGPVLSLRRVGFMHGAPRSAAEHSRIFQAPVLFEQPFHALVFDRALLELPVPAADPQLAQVLDRFMAQSGADAAQPVRFTDQVRQRIAEQMKGQAPAVEQVAARMHMSPRTLQRRLQDEGTRYADVVNDLRRELALRYLEQGRESISEIAFLLGFSEVSTFHRAFKRWCGKTPAEYRRQR